MEVNKPRCPTCGSTNVEKIPSRLISKDGTVVTAEAVRFLVFGARKNEKQFACRNCGYKW